MNMHIQQWEPETSTNNKKDNLSNFPPKELLPRISFLMKALFLVFKIMLLLFFSILFLAIAYTLVINPTD